MSCIKNDTKYLHFPFDNGYKDLNDIIWGTSEENFTKSETATTTQFALFDNILPFVNNFTSVWQK